VIDTVNGGSATDASTASSVATTEIKNAHLIEVS